MGMHSIIVIKNNKNEYLQYFDKNWNSYLFLNCKLPKGEDSNLVINKVSDDLNIEKEFINVSFVGYKKHKKFSESAKIEKEYIHYFYNAKIDIELNNNEFEVSGTKYKWFSYSDLKNDKRIQEVNSDIVRFYKRIQYLINFIRRLFYGGNNMLEQVNQELKKYIEEKILTQYDANNVGGHGREHIQTVIERSFELIEAFNLDVDPNMVYTIAAFHDIGYRKDPDKHEEESSKMFLGDSGIAKFFTQEQIKTIAEAIVDHRASLEYEARSIYGKLVSSADRAISVENMLERSILFQADKHRSEKPTVRQVIDYSYKKLSSKYGKGGYAKMYFQDKKYLDYIQRMQEILDDKNKFAQAELDIMNKKLRKQIEKEEQLDIEF